MNETHQSTARQRKISNGLLLLTSILWGSGFIPQRFGADRLTPFTFNGFRFIAAGLTLLFLAKFKLPREKRGRRISVIAGFVLFIGSFLQQTGIKTTTIGNASFITTTYVVLVPFLSLLLFRDKVKPKAYLAAGIALVGLYFLSTAGKPLAQISRGDLIVFLGSIFWALHIILIGRATAITDPVQFSAAQFLVCAALNLACWGIFEGCPTERLLSMMPLILYSGVFVIGAGFTLQALAQKHADSSQAAIILGLESVFGSIFGMIIFHERFTLVQALGALLIFISVLISVHEEKPAAVVEPRT